MGSEGLPYCPLKAYRLSERLVLPVQRQGKEHHRLRADSGHHRRIIVIMILLGLVAFVPMAAQLAGLMIGSYDYYSRKAIVNHISNIRKKLKITPDIPEYIKSVHSIGYKFEVK